MATNSYDTPVLDTYHAVVLAFSDFLTVAIHTILYERDIYPRQSFLSARKYNYPVKQSRHPKVCKWILDAVAAVEVEMLKVRANARSLGPFVIPFFLEWWFGHFFHSSRLIPHFCIAQNVDTETLLSSDHTGRLDCLKCLLKRRMPMHGS
jgi:hypothetical protein